MFFLFYDIISLFYFFLMIVIITLLSNLNKKLNNYVDFSISRNEPVPKISGMLPHHFVDGKFLILFSIKFRATVLRVPS